MSKLTELLDELCPDGVEFVELGSICDVRSGWGFPRSEQGVKSEVIPFFKVGDMNRRGNEIVMNVAGNYIAEATSEKLGVRPAPAGTIIFPKIGAAIATNKKRILREKSAYDNNVMGLVPRDAIDPAFLFHWIQSVNLTSWGNDSGAVPSIRKTTVEKVLIPLPPLEVQQEIVRVLDAFTDLEQSLVSELELRKKQFDFYSDLLMTPKTSNSWVRLGEIATIVRGASPRPIKKFIVEGDVGIPWIKIGDVPDDGKYVSDTAQKITEEGAKKSRRVAPGDFILSNSMSFGRPYISQIHGCIHDGWLAISSFEKTFRSDYLYYLLRSRPVQVEFARRAGAGTVKNLNADIVKSVVVPAPSLDDQDDVVARLDVFSELIQTIEQEINLRRTQYEFYRDELLSFTPKED